MSRLVLLLLGSPLLASMLFLADTSNTGGPPSTILVVGHVYHIYFVSQGETRKGRRLELGAHGDTFTRDRVILVEKGLDHDLTRHILFHEVGHACYYEHVHLGNRPITLNQDAYTTEEEAVSSISNEMWQVIRDNPEFVRWLEQRE
jgi:hypothetical protein